MAPQRGHLMERVTTSPLASSLSQVPQRNSSISRAFTGWVPPCYTFQASREALEQPGNRWAGVAAPGQ